MGGKKLNICLALILTGDASLRHSGLCNYDRNVIPHFRLLHVSRCSVTANMYDPLLRFIWRCLFRYTSLTQADKISDLAETNCANILCVEIYCIRLVFGVIVTSGVLFYFFLTGPPVKIRRSAPDYMTRFFLHVYNVACNCSVGVLKVGDTPPVGPGGEPAAPRCARKHCGSCAPFIHTRTSRGKHFWGQGTSRAPIDHPPRSSYRYRAEFWACYERKPSWNWPTIVNWTFRRPKVVRQRILHACASSYPALNKS